MFPPSLLREAEGQSAVKNFIKEGEYIDFITPSGGLASGVGYQIGASIFGITQKAGAEGDRNTIKRTGVFEVAKVSAQAWTLGALIYWDNTAKLFTTVSTSNLLVGSAHAAAADPSAVGQVLLKGL